jgi:hypothetical protein
MKKNKEFDGTIFGISSDGTWTTPLPPVNWYTRDAEETLTGEDITRFSRKSPTPRTGTTHCVREPRYAPSSQSPVSLREMATSSETKFLGSQQAMLAWENWRRRTVSTNPLIDASHALPGEAAFQYRSIHRNNRFLFNFTEEGVYLAPEQNLSKNIRWAVRKTIWSSRTKLARTTIPRHTQARRYYENRHDSLRNTHHRCL